MFIGLDSNTLNQIQKYQLVFARIRNISNYLGDAIGRKLFLAGFSEKYVQGIKILTEGCILTLIVKS